LATRSARARPPLAPASDFPRVVLILSFLRVSPAAASPFSRAHSLALLCALTGSPARLLSRARSPGLK
jgi:hypothetical protein